MSKYYNESEFVSTLHDTTFLKKMLEIIDRILDEVGGGITNILFVGDKLRVTLNSGVTKDVSIPIVSASQPGFLSISDYLSFKNGIGTNSGGKGDTIEEIRISDDKQTYTIYTDKGAHSFTIPLATTNNHGLISKEDYRKLRTMMFLPISNILESKDESGINIKVMVHSLRDGGNGDFDLESEESNILIPFANSTTDGLIKKEMFDSISHLINSPVKERKVIGISNNSEYITEGVFKIAKLKRNHVVGFCVSIIMNGISGRTRFSNIINTDCFVVSFLDEFIVRSLFYKPKNVTSVSWDGRDIAINLESIPSPPVNGNIQLLIDVLFNNYDEPVLVLPEKLDGEYSNRKELSFFEIREGYSLYEFLLDGEVLSTFGSLDGSSSSGGGPEWKTFPI